MWVNELMYRILICQCVLGVAASLHFYSMQKRKKKLRERTQGCEEVLQHVATKLGKKGGGKNETPPLNFFSKKHFAKRCYFTGFYTLYQGPFSTPEHAKLSLKGNKNGIFRYTMASNL
jgi:hypothetical protein